MMHTLGDRLRCARESMNLSQTDLAKRTGFLPSAISHYETNRRAPTVRNLVKLCEALNVTADYLLANLRKISP